MNIKFVDAKPEHKEYLLQANAEINQVNEVNHENSFSKNLDKDLFTKNPKFHCLVALDNKTPVGMILYSFMYWADDGQVMWISQAHVKKEYRKKGVFLEMIHFLEKKHNDVKLMSCATGKPNKRMQQLLNYAGGKQMDLLFYYIRINKQK